MSDRLREQIEQWRDKEKLEARQEAFGPSMPGMPAAPPVLQAEPDVQQLISAVYATITPKDGIRKTVVLAGLHRIAERAERAAFEKAAQVAEGMNTVSAMHADGLRDPRIVALDIAKGIRALADSPVSGGAPKCTCGNSADGICRPGPTCGNW